MGLGVGGEVVHLELSADPAAGGIEALADDGGGGSIEGRAGALPDHHEISAGLDAHRREDLVAGDVGIDLELDAQPTEIRRETLGLDLVAGEIGSIGGIGAGPGHHEAAVLVGDVDRRQDLAAGGVAIDLEVLTERDQILRRGRAGEESGENGAGKEEKSEARGSHSGGSPCQTSGS